MKKRLILYISIIAAGAVVALMWLVYALSGTLGGRSEYERVAKQVYREKRTVPGGKIGKEIIIDKNPPNVLLGGATSSRLSRRPGGKQEFVGDKEEAQERLSGPKVFLSDSHSRPKHHASSRKRNRGDVPVLSAQEAAERLQYMRAHMSAGSAK